jgi:hypothetical protein
MQRKAASLIPVHLALRQRYQAATHAGGGVDGRLHCYYPDNRFHLAFGLGSHLIGGRLIECAVLAGESSPMSVDRLGRSVHRQFSHESPCSRCLLRNDDCR